jgi:hypothetical protein
MKSEQMLEAYDMASKLDYAISALETIAATNPNLKQGKSMYGIGPEAVLKELIAVCDFAQKAVKELSGMKIT